MKIIEYCGQCMGNLAKLRHSYYLFYSAFIDDYMKGKLTDFKPLCNLKGYTESMLRELENEGYIVTTELDEERIRIKPLGVNEVMLSSKMTDQKHAMVMICLDMDAHQHSYELDENVLEE